MSKFPLNTMLAAAMTTATILPLPAAACGVEPFLGEVCSFAFTFCPKGYAPANGQIMSIAQNTALFALLGTTYGGNGQTTFALPDLRGRSLVGSGQGPGLSPVVIGEAGGTELVTLTLDQMPFHSHSAATTVNANSAVNAVSGAGNTMNPSGKVWATSSSRDNVYSNAAPNANMAAGAVTTTASASTIIGPAGGNQPFSNLPPFLGITYCIATQGIFPSQN